MPRLRVVASDWLVTIDTNRYSVPWRLIDATVEVLRVGEAWQIPLPGTDYRARGALGRHRLEREARAIAVARNARKRYAQSAILVANSASASRSSSGDLAADREGPGGGMNAAN